MKRTIEPVVRIAKPGELDERAERRRYWSAQPIERKLSEVEELRRLWTAVTGDPDRPIERVVHRRRLGEAAVTPPPDAGA